MILSTQRRKPMRRLAATAFPSGSYPRKGPLSLEPVSSAKKPKNENGDGTKMALKWDEAFDVICVGSGLGGLSAALTQAQRGARAIVLEKLELLGGVSAQSSGPLWLGPHHLQERDGRDDTDAVADDYLNHLLKAFRTPERRSPLT